MNTKKRSKKKVEPSPDLVLGVLLAIGTPVIGWLGFLLGGGGPDLTRATQVSNALAFVGTLATAGALGVGFWSLGVQREELRLQRRELRMQRRAMIDSRKELEKTAEAQEALAQATQQAVFAQRTANHRSLSSMITQLTLGVAAIEAVVASQQKASLMTDAEARAIDDLQAIRDRLKSNIDGVREVIEFGDEE